jgi:hypothetical protein
MTIGGTNTSVSFLLRTRTITVSCSPVESERIGGFLNRHGNHQLGFTAPIKTLASFVPAGKTFFITLGEKYLDPVRTGVGSE